VALGFLVRTGSRHERADEHGVSHFLEHMCFKGTPRRNWHDITIGFDQLGSIYNAYTGKEHTIYYGWVPAARMEAQLELLADMMRPRLAAEDFETERKVILEEIAMTGDNFDTQVWNFLHETCFGRHALAHEILGEHETIARVPREILLAYHRQRYAAGNMTLVAAGAVEPEAVFAAAGRHCGDWGGGTNGARAVEPPPALRSGAFRKRLEQFKQQSVVLVYPSIPHGDERSETVEAFQSLFGGMNSRCYWNIVQKGICSQAGGAWISYADCGVIALYADGEPEKADEMLAALREQARQVSRDGFRGEEVRRVRNRRRTTLALESENPRTRLMQIVDDLEAHGAPRPAEARLAAVEAVSAESIAAYLRGHPITGDGLLISAGPRDWP
jgi:predicted Zn-dependent peptidase